MRSFLSKLVLLPCCIVLTHCVSMSSMQNARTMKKGEFGSHLGLGAQSTKFKKYSDEAKDKEVQESIEKLSMPVLEGALRYGIVEQFEAGAKVALLPGSYSLSGKYMLLGKGSDFALATGANVDYGSFSVSSGSGDAETKSSIRIVDLTVPLYTSYDVASWLSLYLTPRFGTRMTQSKTSTKSSNSSVPVWGVNTGVILGWLGVEYAMLDQVDKNSSAFLQQVTVGIIMGSDQWER